MIKGKDILMYSTLVFRTIHPPQPSSFRWIYVLKGMGVVEQLGPSFSREFYARNRELYCVMNFDMKIHDRVND